MHHTAGETNFWASGTISQRTLLQGRPISGLLGQSPNRPYCGGDEFLVWWDNAATHPTAGQMNFLAGGTISQPTLLQGRRISGMVGQSPNAPFSRGDKFLGWWDNLPTHPTAEEINFWTGGTNFPTHPTAGETNFWAGGTIS